MVGMRARRMWSQIVWVLRRSNNPATHKEAWLVSAAMLVPGAVIFYVLTAIAGHFGVQTPSLAFDALLAAYSSAIGGLLASYKIHRRRARR